MTAVSVLIRTTGRQAALASALVSLAAQHFRDFEVVVVEDGPGTLADFLASYSSPRRGEAGRGAGGGMGGGDGMLIPEAHSTFSPHPNPPPTGEGMTIRYEATGERRGRMAAGNRAFELSRGEYCLFLDDDDEIRPEHLSLLMQTAAGGRIAYSWAERRYADRDGQGNITRRGRLTRRLREPFSLIRLATGNFMAINAVLFHRSLFEQAGGFKPEPAYLEDWLLWLRFAALEPHWPCVRQATAVNYEPLDRAQAAERKRAFHACHPAVREQMGALRPDWSMLNVHEDARRHFALPLFLRRLYYHATSYLP